MKNRCKKLLLLLLLVGITPAVMAQYGFGTNTPDKSAVVDVNSTTKGFLPPRLSQTQIDALAGSSPSPAEGLVVYNTGAQRMMYYCLGEFLDFYRPAGLAPVASDVTATGNMLAGATLIATYNYTQGDSLKEGKPTYKWYSATGSDGSNIKFFSGSDKTYTIPSGKEGTYVRVGVTPVTVTGKTGSEVLSSWREVVTNAAPEVSGVKVKSTIVGGATFMVGSTLTADVPSSSITDLENNGPFTLLYKWYSATVPEGALGAQLTGSNNTNTCTIPLGKEGTYVRLGVTPIATAGTSPGVETYSQWYRVNSAPSYTGLHISSNRLSVGKTVEVVGTYSDGDGDPAGTHTYLWYRCTDAAGSNKSPISGATWDSYTFNPADLGLYIRVSVTPKATKGVTPGAEQFASTVDPIGITVKHKADDGVSPVDGDITYPVVKFGGKFWLGRNLGATTAPSKVDDGTPAAAGWYWQFNRKQGYSYDGTRNPSGSWPDGDGTNSDWLPANDPCTILGSGWRLPTRDEWVGLLSPYPTGSKLYDSDLKLHAAGYLGSGGLLTDRGNNGTYWSKTQYNADWVTTLNLHLSGSYATVLGDCAKANGLSVRCVRD